MLKVLISRGLGVEGYEISGLGSRAWGLAFQGFMRSSSALL